MIDLSKLVLYDSTHRYFYNGRQLIAVTDVFEKTGLSDFSKIKWEVLEDAKIKGDFVHEIARLFANKTLKPKSIDYRLEGYYRAVKKFFKERVKKIIAVEKPICDPYHGYAGQPDIVYEDFKGLICLDDYKTPERPHPTWKYQTAGYKNAWDKCFPKLKIRNRAGVMLKPDGTYERHEHHGAQEFDKFIDCLSVANIKIEEKINT